MLKRTALSLFLVFFVSIGSIVVSATQHFTLGVTTQSVSEEIKSDIVKSLDLEILKSEEGRSEIKCFDISTTGMIAIATDTGSISRIYIYDQNGIFQYGYRFSVDGAYGIGFNGQNLAIYLIRGDIICIVDSSGNCLDIQKIIEPGHHLSKELLYRTKKIFEENEYTLERDIGIGDGYSRLVKTDSQNVDVILYDVTTNHIIKQIVLILCIVGFFSLCVYGVYQKQRSIEKKE